MAEKDLIRRVDVLNLAKGIVFTNDKGEPVFRHICVNLESVRSIPAVDAVEVVRCGECIHQPHQRPGYTEMEDSGFSLEFPDEICPFYCPDEWYNAAPPEGFYCAYGEKAR